MLDQSGCMCWGGRGVVSAVLLDACRSMARRRARRLNLVAFPWRRRAAHSAAWVEGLLRATACSLVPHPCSLEVADV